MTAEELENLVKLHVSQLREHVDAVRIFVSVDPEEGNSVTRYCATGSGNIFSQLGHVKDWIAVMDERARKQAVEEEE